MRTLTGIGVFLLLLCSVLSTELINSKISFLESYYHGKVLHEGLMVDKLSNVFVNKLIRKISRGDKTFKIGGIGSSVMAAHDVCYADSFFKQLERFLSPILLTLGMRLELQNTGIGGACGNSHRNRVYCVSQDLSADVDFMLYEYTYFEGRDGGYAQHEMMLRWSQLSDDPPIMFIVHDGGKKNIKCMHKRLFSRYFASTGLNGMCVETALFSNTVYSGKKWGAVGDGQHDHTRYCDNCQPDRKESSGIVWMNWHNGPLSHELIADVISHYILRHFRAAHGGVAVVVPPVPGPLLCNSTLCGSRRAPSCLDYDVPNYGSSGGITYLGNSPHKTDDTESLRLIPKLERRMFPLSYCKHLDSCGWIEVHGEAVFKIPKLDVGLIFVCKCCGKDGASHHFRGLRVLFDSVDITREYWRQFPESKCIEVLNDSKYAGKGPFILKLVSNDPMYLSQVVSL